MNLNCTVYLNRIPQSYNIFDDFHKAQDYHAKHGVILQYDFINTDVHGYVSTFRPELNRWLIQANNLVPTNTSDITIFVFDQAEWATPAGSQFPLRPDTPNGYCFPFLGKPFVEIGRYIQADAVQIMHELMHALVEITKASPDVMDSYRENWNPDSPTGNFAQQWSILSPYITKPMWKHFTLTESTGGGHTVAELKTHLVDLLDQARDIAGVPFVITSGFRTPSENAAVGGVADSAHLTGEAADLACSSALTRWLIVNSLLKVGFNRLEVAKNHIHCDVSKTLPQNIIDYTNLA